MNLKKKLLEGILIAGAGLVSVGFIAGVVEQGKYERTRRKVQFVIDSDNNKVYTKEEWKPVYEFFGVRPKKYGDDWTGYGFDLTRKQLEKYLENKAKRGD